MLRTADLDYDLPESAIAKEPASPRDAARLMVIDRASGDAREHTIVRELPRLLRQGDVLVFNATRVLQARLVGRREDSGGRVEGLFLSASSDGREWTALLRAKKVRENTSIRLIDEHGADTEVTLVPLRRDASETGAWVVGVRVDGGASGPGVSPLDPAAILDRVGHTPLPPYILKAREHTHEPVERASDRDRYQTVYAKQQGSVAAPTAGLHFTPELLAAIDAVGVERVEVTLHVGTGTFKPVEVDIVEEHPMHSEWCSMSEASVERVTRAKAQGRRVIGVGTTSVRTLESYALHLEQHRGAPPASLDTRLLITPGYRYRWVDGMLTNFHLPRSTLLAMVGALLSDRGTVGVQRLIDRYREAIASGYRFYSFGDAMLIA
ncbi:MAG: tRNA preQ1(34) S-adenosylmethionine ribosyltransferase-isomerase QueA [Phycisphaerales bacterium]|nr:tRNA preQ1(34) S-adenosylmethionine ribosyltransferase-isomerase QueA [Phycisphaerales bacterium]